MLNHELRNGGDYAYGKFSVSARLDSAEVNDPASSRPSGAFNTPVYFVAADTGRTVLIPAHLRHFEVVESGCWIWKRALNHKGYGQSSDHSNRGAHRGMFVAVYGEIAAGLEIDHLCRVRACVNPEHLEAVTHKVNLLRGNTFQARNVAKTHCPYGHAYIGDNVRLYRGKRHCRACVRLFGKRPRTSARPALVADANAAQEQPSREISEKGANGD